MSDNTDYGKHTDEELREGVEQAERNDPRIAEDSSDEALEAEREQREAMADELQSREGDGA